MPTREQQLQTIQEGIRRAREQFEAMQQRITTEGITGAGGEMLLEPTAPPPPPPGGNGDADMSLDADWRQLYLDTIKKYMEYDPMAARAGYKEELGIPGMEEKATGITQEVLDVEGLLDNLEEDISARVTRLGGVMTEPQRRRRLAAEATPLREQLSDLMRAEERATIGLTGARGELASMMQMEQYQQGRGLEMLPYLQEMMAEPEAPKAPTMKEWGGRMYQWDGAGWVDIGEAGVEKAPTYPTSYKEWQLAGSPGTFEEWLDKDKTTSAEEEAQYKSGLLADKKEGMTYEDAVDLYGSHINKGWIDWVYKKGKELTEKEKAEETYYKEYNEWMEKVNKDSDKYYIETDGVYESIPWRSDKKVFTFKK